MPFRSKSQIKACFAQYKLDLSQNKVPRWNCYSWMLHTKNPNKLPNKIKLSKRRSSKRSKSVKRRSIKRRSSKRRSSKRRSRK